MHTSIKHLKDHLSEYVHRAQQGEEVIITSHKQPVAKLIPIAKNEISLTDKHKELLAEISSFLKKQNTLQTDNTMRQLIIKIRQQERY